MSKPVTKDKVEKSQERHKKLAELLNDDEMADMVILQANSKLKLIKAGII